jgi:elongation factor G
MTHPGRAVHRILSFAVYSIPLEDRPSVLQKLEGFVLENPRLRAEVHVDHDKIFVSGEDELQLLELRVKVIQQELAEPGDLKVNYLETVLGSAEAEHSYLRETGGSRNYGYCRLRVEPGQQGSGLQFLYDLDNEVIARQSVQAIEAGVREAAQGGILQGCELVNVKATLLASDCDEVGRHEMSLRIAGAMAFREAAKRARPVVLEPMVEATIDLPTPFMSSVMEDIHARRGRIESTSKTVDGLLIRASIPIAEVLRSSSRGRSGYSTRFLRYEPVRRSRGSDDEAGTGVLNPWPPHPRRGAAAMKVLHIPSR